MPPTTPSPAKTFSKTFDKPFALAMGPQRSGTTWLDRYLRMRGDICMPRSVKEIFFFDRHYHKGTRFYKSHFHPLPADRLIMEISTTAFDHPEAPQRVKETLGNDIKLLCPLRHPVIRTYSLYLHNLRYGRVTGSLQEACAQKPDIINSSKYAGHIENWLKHFPKDAIHFVFQEELKENENAFVTNVCNALEIPLIPAPADKSIPYNATTYSRFPTLAKFSQYMADWLRAHRFYFIINASKLLGLKRIIFGKENPETQKYTIPPHDRAWLEKQLAGEIEALEALIGPIPYWEKY